MRKEHKVYTYQQGFTLIEIILVLGIIAVLMGAAIYSLGGARDTAKVQRVQSDFLAIESALRLYEIDNGFLPTTRQGLKALVEKPTSKPIPKNWKSHMKKLNRDPWKNPYQYRNPGKHDTATYEVYSLGPDGEEGTEDDIGTWMSDEEEEE